MKIIIKLSLLVMAIFSIYLVGTQNLVLAEKHQESLIHGYSVDEDQYEINWSSQYVLSVYENDEVKGTVTTYVGVAHSKFSLSSGKKASIVMIKSIINPVKYTYKQKILWWTRNVTEYGVASKLNYTMNFYSRDAEIMDVSPKNQPSSNTYSVGTNLGINASSTPGVNLGVSASQTFTANALKITNESNRHNRKAATSFEYRVSPFRFDWERDSYNFYESEQKASYTVASTRRDLGVLFVTAEFDSVNSTPSHWQNYLSKKSQEVQLIYVYV